MVGRTLGISSISFLVVLALPWASVIPVRELGNFVTLKQLWSRDSLAFSRNWFSFWANYCNVRRIETFLANIFAYAPTWNQTGVGQFKAHYRTYHAFKSILFNWAIPASFSFTFGNFKQQHNFTTNKCNKWSIYYAVLGFKLMTSWTWVSSHNHQTRVHAKTYFLTTKSNNKYRK